MTASNGSGSVTRPANTTSYGSGAVTKLLANNTTGNASATPISIAQTVPGRNYVTAARLQTTGTGASGATFKVHLYSSAPTLTGLADGSTYVGPYAADLPNYVGSISFAPMVATNDGTPQYWADGVTDNQVTGPLPFPGGPGTTTTVYAVFEVTTGYTPISGEIETLYLNTSY